MGIEIVCRKYTNTRVCCLQNELKLDDTDLKLIRRLKIISTGRSTPPLTYETLSRFSIPPGRQLPFNNVSMKCLFIRRGQRVVEICEKESPKSRDD